jgi:hypothetical protein
MCALANQELMGLLPYRLALLLERLLPRPHPKPPPALVRAYQEPRSPLTLNLPYYAARKGKGFALIPWDRYMEEAENLLQGLGEEGP